MGAGHYLADLQSGDSRQALLPLTSTWVSTTVQVVGVKGRAQDLSFAL